MPGRADSCRDSPARLMMNNSAATMYAAAAMLCASMGAESALREHAEHPAGHGEAAEDVDAGQQHGDEGEHPDHRLVPADLEQRAHDDDPGDRIRDRHQRRMQRVV